MSKTQTKAAVILAALIVILSAAPVFAGPRFPDVAGHWAEKFINALADKGIIKGMDDGLFHPDEQVTTAQFVTMIYQGAGETIAPIDDYWASGYLDSALERKIMDNSDYTRSDKPILRRAVATIGHKALVTIFEEPDEEDTTSAVLEWIKKNQDSRCASGFTNRL